MSPLEALRAYALLGLPVGLVAGLHELAKVGGAGALELLE